MRVLMFSIVAVVMLLGCHHGEHLTTDVTDISYRGDGLHILDFERDPDGFVYSRFHSSGEALLGRVTDCSTKAAACVAFRGRVFVASTVRAVGLSEKFNNASITLMGCARGNQLGCEDFLYRSQCALPVIDERCAADGSEGAVTIFYVLSPSRGVLSFADQATCIADQNKTSCVLGTAAYWLETKRGLLGS